MESCLRVGSCWQLNTQYQHVSQWSVTYMWSMGSNSHWCWDQSLLMMIFRAHYIDRSIAKGQNIKRENISLVALLTGARFANPKQLLKDRKDAHVGDSYTNFCSCPNFLIFSCYIQYLELHIKCRSQKPPPSAPRVWTSTPLKSRHFRMPATPQPSSIPILNPNIYLNYFPPDIAKQFEFSRNLLLVTLGISICIDSS